ncbi:DUF2235 domain-containing protein [Roseivivax sediminis]|uniref:Uncharacterized protein, PA2063/DUF2235 family n=1 Tax=Roseivivax sediminis TaxID=936889 RepID=A0A1I2ERJ1_9RHOB|nr:DUF2235 domain-containing protein [Roseivivax sediminis]SFE94840.1 Uncharacterized protein, PA2063/DUF2235 family [Roseivivax sediminis]
MKRIAIFCDGTWNRSDAPNPTNVVKLAQAAQRTSSDGHKQVVFYHRGVGTGAGLGRVSKKVDQWFGGAFGAGLTENVQDAYRALVFAYEPGDEIYLFGFSRGAYTARSLAGLIRASSIFDVDHVGAIPEALTRYRSRDEDTKPDSEASFEFRAKYAPSVVTSEKEADWRRERGRTDFQQLRITYVGVWDTVGALGVPQHLSALAKVFNKKFDFHDTSLSRSVAAARHAVALDERRVTFPPALWGNVAKLNAEAPSEGDDVPYRQEWFPGDHGSVGGGGDVVGLSNAALLWIAEGAATQGLEFDVHALNAFETECDHRVSLRNVSEPGFSVMDKLTRLKLEDRDGPEEPQRAAHSTVARYREPAQNLYERVPYRPGSLARVEASLTPAEGGTRRA